MSAEFQIGFRMALLIALCITALLVFIASDARPRVREVARLVFVAAMIAILIRA